MVFCELLEVELVVGVSIDLLLGAKALEATAALSCGCVFAPESGNMYDWSIRKPPSLLNRSLLSFRNCAFASGVVRP